MKKVDCKVMGDFGLRFLLFRKALRKTQFQLANEVGAKLSDIRQIENGTEYPEINYLHFLNKKYGLNINWVLCNEGEMFIKELPPGVDTDYVMKLPVKSGDPIPEKYAEFFQLMQIPAIEKAIMAQLEEFKTLLRKEK
jgi:transcriptional regulator with XRE-family HTH domain